MRQRIPRGIALAAATLCAAALASACSARTVTPAADSSAAPSSAVAATSSASRSPGASASSRAPAAASSAPADPSARPSSPPGSDGQGPAKAKPAPAYCRHGGSRLWSHLARCGWPGPGNTGPVRSRCPGGRLKARGGSLTHVITIRRAGTVISCQSIRGRLDIRARNVTIRNSIIRGSSGRTGEAANGTAGIVVDDGASATVNHVLINGEKGVHACIWHQGTRLTVNAVNCFGVDDGIFSWADNGFSRTTGDHFTIRNSYFHNLTTRTSNGHEDGYQTEGASFGLIAHNTYRMTGAADSAIAIWDSLRSSKAITVRHNLITGGGFSIYAEDYSPGAGDPGNPSARGGYTDTRIRYIDNRFSTRVSGCVGAFGVWFTRPTWRPYHGGPTDGWHRRGNRVLETGQNIDKRNPSRHGALCT